MLIAAICHYLFTVTLHSSLTFPLYLDTGINLCRQIAACKYKIYMQMIATCGLLSTDMLCLSSSD